MTSENTNNANNSNNDSNNDSNNGLALQVAIVGAGPVGLTLALMLRQLRPDLHLSLFERKPAARLGQDERTLVLSEASRQLLARFGAWPEGTRAITRIHVSQQGAGLSALPRVLLEATRQRLPAFGYVMPYPVIWGALAQRATELGAQMLTDTQAGWPVPTPDGRALLRIERAGQAPQMQAFDLVVLAEGGVFHEQPRRVLHSDYAQTAVVCHARARPAAGAAVDWDMAFERFTPQGPLALIPSALQGWHYTVVHCVPQADAESVRAWSEAERVQRLNALLPAQAPRLFAMSAPFAVPLGLNATWGLVEDSMPVVRVGNAAQTMHPVAGQGLNVGLRDAWQLSEQLRHWQPWQSNDEPVTQEGNPPSPAMQGGMELRALLRRYQQARQPDRLSMLLATELLARGFTGGSRLLGALRAAGLAITQGSSFARRRLVDFMLYGWV